MLGELGDKNRDLGIKAKGFYHSQPNQQDYTYKMDDTEVVCILLKEKNNH